MNKLFVKICGITRLQDAELASALGAAAVGFVFWPGSPRYIAAEAARRIAGRLPAEVMKVGVFVDQPVDRIVQIADEVGLDAVQLHGRETPEYCRRIAARLDAVGGRGVRPKPETTNVRLKPDTATDETTNVRLKPDTTTDETMNVRLKPGTTSDREREEYVVSAFRRTVIKAVGMTANGAVNIADVDADVTLLIDAHDPVLYGGTGRTVNWDAVREIAGTRPTILAGGLNPANVTLAVRSVRPYGVDVSSGVESAPGVKDPERLRSFFEALHD